MTDINLSNITLNDQIAEAQSRIPYLEQVGGKGLMMPSNPTNSGPRKIMFSTQLEHLLGLYIPEVPLLGTGYEQQFAKHSSSFCVADDDYVVCAKIDKFSFIRNHHYWLIVQNLRTLEYDVIERVPYEHITESYGFLYNNDILDRLHQGSRIAKDTVYKKTNAFDEHNNRMDGANLNVTYISNEYTKEDAFIISDIAAEKMAAPLVKKIRIVINDNDIPLNMYGNQQIYKPFQDIGETIKNGVLMSIRREKNEESLFAQSIDRLQEIMISDDTYDVHGTVADIDIMCNNQEALETNPYFEQLKFYNNQKIAFQQNFVTIVEPLIRTGKCSYELQKMYTNFKEYLDGKKYIIDKPFSNVVIEFTILDKNKVQVGDKLSNRYGGKGVVSAILPQALMPKAMIGQDEVYVDIVYNSSTCVNRENPGQLFESSINFIGANIVEYMKYNVLEIGQYLDMLETFFRVVAPKQAIALCEYLNSINDEGRKMFIESIIESGGINVSQEPMSESMTLDKLAYLYKELPWISQAPVMVPQEDSNGNIRYIQARRKLVVAKQYIFRLKQYGEEKFSAVSLSATNIRNENIRSNAKKTHKSIHSKTPVKFFGEMETNDLMHSGVENVIINLMLHSSSPSGRRLCEALLVDNPFDIDIRLDNKCANRSVEILNCYLTTMGLRLKFTRVPKQIKQVYLRKVYTPVDHYEMKKPYSYVKNPDEKMIPSVLEAASKGGYDENGLKIPFLNNVYKRL